MREIKFRGIQRFGENKGKWAYGSLLILGLRQYIIPKPPKYETPADDITLLAQVCERVEVDAESVGQYTTRKDKNNKEIYDGDTLKNPKDTRGNGLFDVAWSEMFHGWIGNSQTECLQMKPCMFDESEITGNIYEPPANGNGD